MKSLLGGVVAFAGAVWYTLIVAYSVLFGIITFFLKLPDMGKLDKMSKTFNRDITALLRYSKARITYNRMIRSGKTIPILFLEQAAKHPDKTCFINSRTGKSYTFKEVDEFSNQVANCFKNRGYKAGDEIALFMDSCAEYAMIWLGLAKLGMVIALINTNQRKDPLVHSVTCVNAKGLIFGTDLVPAVRNVHEQITAKTGKNFQYFCFGGVESELNDWPGVILNPLICDSSKEFRVHEGAPEDTLLYIYTSGTTGLPKAAIIKHSRFLISSLSMHYMIPLKEDDIVYITLPLYHGSCGMLGVGQVFIHGNTGVVSPRFTASHFWDECTKYKCTTTLYIGEMCRYLLQQPEKPIDKSHTIRLMFGNGLRPQLWRDFQSRFNIPEIREFFASTEGNANLINTDNTPGAVGFLPVLKDLFPGLLNRVHPVRLIRVDEQTGEPLRDERGLCIQCKAGETGEMVGLTLPSNLQKYDGYVNKEATKKKLYRDVVRKGDSAFASGDLLYMDSLGYLYFKDRTGDTFRWKGENVSTTEVEAIISKVLNLKDCVAFGVEVPGTEGRAGMAAIVNTDGDVDLDSFLAEIKAALPPYAIPLFIRFMQQVDTTGTMKFKKVELRKTGFDPSKCQDPLYFLDSNQKKYISLNNEVYDRIINGKCRL